MPIDIQNFTKGASYQMSLGSVLSVEKQQLKIKLVSPSLF